MFKKIFFHSPLITPWFIILLMIISTVCGACTYLNQRLGLKDDNLAEEISEVVIKNYTGLDVDLTPESPE